MADNAANKKRIAELQAKESAGTLDDEGSAELQRLQQETSADEGNAGGPDNTAGASNR